jgi:uncharacterized protein involved in exopolysaccharide biosynthesis
MTNRGSERPNEGADEQGADLLDLLLPLIEHWKLWVIGSIAVGLAALGVAFALPPVFTARTSLLPPQQQQSALASALGSLGGLTGLAGLSGAVKSPADQYVGLLQSVTVQDRLIEQFDLLRVYDVELKHDARRELETNSRFVAGKKDGLIVIEVDDTDPRRAADLANAYVDELRRLTSVLAVSEAQQRRVFFEKQLKDARDELAKAQKALQATGFDVAALRVEPRAAAENYARLKAQITATEVRVHVLRGTRADSSAELRQELDQLAALRAQLARLEQAADSPGSTDYVTNYREFKYREALFEIFARQYELARVDESSEGALIQILDPALPPERKSRPKRALIAVSATLVSMLLLGGLVLIRATWRDARADPRRATRHERLRAAFGRGAR